MIYYKQLTKSQQLKFSLIFNYQNLTELMSDQHTDDNSAIDDKKITKTSSKENVDNEKKYQKQLRSKSKKRKTMTTTKNNNQRIQNKTGNQQSLGKQMRLTQLWNSANGISQSVSKNSIPNNEFLKRKLQQQIADKEKLIMKYKTQRDNIQKKYNKMEGQKITYQIKSRETIKKSLLQVTKSKRFQKYRLNSQYGFFAKSMKITKDDKKSQFIQGPYTKDIRNQIKEKQKQMENLKYNILSCDSKQQKQLIEFQVRYIQNEISELEKTYAQRVKIVQEYKKRIKFGEIQQNCLYAKLDWPTIGRDNRYQVLELLGSGGYGQVYKCYDLINNQYVALKQNKFIANGKTEQKYRQEYMRHMTRQIEIQKNLNHPNIAKLIQIIKQQDDQISFIMEYCDGPDLSKYLHSYQCLNQNQAKQIIRQLLYAIKYLSEQQNKIIHYDLKPSNIMFNRGVIKIVDFGLCKQIQTGQTRIDLTSQGVGTYWYLPPQTFQQNAEVCCKVDVWSIGVIFYQLLYAIRPFGHTKSQKMIFQEGIIANAKKVEFPDRTPKHFKVSEEAKKFIRQLLKINPKQRLSPAQAYQHNYFK